MSSPEQRQSARVWTHDDVEYRLKEALTTLRRLPMPSNGFPHGGHSAWPDYPYTVADRAGWIVGAESTEHLTTQEREQNRTKLTPSREQIREMDECLDWLMLIRDGKIRRVVFARCHVFDSGRSVYSYQKIARSLQTNRETARQLYRKGIKTIAMRLSQK